MGKANTESTQTTTPAPTGLMLTVTDSAAEKVAALLQLEDNPELKLRIYIVGGGCSGFQYGFTFDTEQASDDWSFSKTLEAAPTPVMDPEDPLFSEATSNTDTPAAHLQEISVLVDKISMQYLVGATVDYKNDLEGERFIIDNPNAKTTCGCGSSFAV